MRLRAPDPLRGHRNRHNPAIGALHTRLCWSGKPKKVMLVAAMRKLLLILNAVIRNQISW